LINRPEPLESGGSGLLIMDGLTDQPIDTASSRDPSRLEASEVRKLRGMTETTPDSIDTVLRSDHAAIKRALAELRINADPRATGDLFEQLTADIVRHFVAEEQYLLPSVRDHLADGEAISTASFAEHERIEDLLKKLDHDDTNDEQIGAALAELEQAIEAHVAAQDSDVLPALVAASDPAELEELGQGVLGAEQLAPTHPRAFVPKSATISKITSWLAGLVEKTLDARDPDDKT
jgi:hemerythrin-like domain-containing protein